jgi:chemotaxis protein MotA
VFPWQIYVFFILFRANSKYVNPNLNIYFSQLDKSTLFGLFFGFALIIWAILIQGDLFVFISISSAIIVVGGIFASTIISFSFKEVRDTASLLLDTLKQTQSDLRTDIEIINMFARKVRRDGLLSMESDIQNIDEPFLKTGFQYLIDGIKDDAILKILSDQLISAERQLDKSVNVLAKMGDYAPAFGMIGTIIGLVLMLQNIDNPHQLGAGLSVALLTTFYGTIFANLVFLPLSEKLNNLGEKQLIRKQMFKSAIIAIMDEENPRIMVNKMLNFIPPSERAESGFL